MYGFEASFEVVHDSRQITAEYVNIVVKSL